MDIFIIRQIKELLQLKNSVFLICYLFLYLDIKVFISFVITNEGSTSLAYLYLIEFCISIQSFFCISFMTQYLSCQWTLECDNEDNTYIYLYLFYVNKLAFFFFFTRRHLAVFNYEVSISAQLSFLLIFILRYSSSSFFFVEPSEQFPQLVADTFGQYAVFEGTGQAM